MGVASPDLQSQEGGEGDPGQVGEKQGPRQGTKAPEENQCDEEEEEPEEEDLEKRESPQTPREEQPGPKGVEGQLNQEEPEGRSGAVEAILPPDHPSGNAHHEVENRPDRAEEVRRRGPGGAKELPVEAPGLDGGGGAERGGGKHGNHPRQKAENRLETRGSVHHHPITSLESSSRKVYRINGPAKRGEANPCPFSVRGRGQRVDKEKPPTTAAFRLLAEHRFEAYAFSNSLK